MMIIDVIFDFSKINGQTVVIAVIGWLIVFLSLLLLFFIFQNIPVLIYFKRKKERKKTSKNENNDKMNIEISGDFNAAIAMALYLYANDLHDQESNIITIKRIEKPYSSWNSKIYGVQGNQYFKNK